MATSHANRAMLLDPDLAEAHAATGSLLYERWLLEDSLPHYERAIRINPNYAIVYNWMALSLFNLGRYGEGVAALEKAVQLDPLSRPILSTYVYWLINLNRHSEAEKELDKLASIHPVIHAMSRGDLTSLGGKWANRVLANLEALALEPSSVQARVRLAADFVRLDLSEEALAMAMPRQTYLYRWLGKHEDAVAAAKAALAEDPMNPFASQRLGSALAAAGYYAQARPVLEETWRRSGKQVTRYGVFQQDNAAALVAIRRDAGDEDGVDELVTAILDDVGHLLEAGVTVTEKEDSVDYSEGIAAYLAGDRERGLALIARAVEDGIFIPPHEAYLHLLYTDPDFAPIRASQEARQVREREKFLAIVCNDNPYAAVWQPAEGTCEQFLAAQ